MSATLTARKVRLQSDASTPDTIIDRQTGEALRLPARSDWRFEVGIFVALNGSAPSSASQIPDPTADAWQTLELIFQSTAGTNIVYGTTSSFTLPTAATWNADTAQHAVITQDDAESNIAPGLYHIALRLTTVGGKLFNVGTGAVEVFTAYDVNTTGGDPDVNPGAPISLEVADSRYAALGPIPASGLTIGTGKLAGRYSAGTGPLQEITPGTGLTLNPSTGVLEASGGGSGDMTLDGIQTVTGAKTFEGSTLQVKTTGSSHNPTIGTIIKSNEMGISNVIDVRNLEYTTGGAAGLNLNILRTDLLAMDSDGSLGYVGDLDFDGVAFGLAGPLHRINATTGTLTGTWNAQGWGVDTLNLRNAGTTFGQVTAGEAGTATWHSLMLGLNLTNALARPDPTTTGMGFMLERSYLSASGVLQDEWYIVSGDRPYLGGYAQSSTANVVSIAPNASGCIVTISNPSPSATYLLAGLRFYFTSLPGTVTVGGLDTVTPYRVITKLSETTFHLGNASLVPITTPNYSGTVGVMNRGGYGLIVHAVPTEISVSDYRHPDANAETILTLRNTKVGVAARMRIDNQDPSALFTGQTWLEFNQKWRWGTNLDGASPGSFGLYNFATVNNPITVEANDRVSIGYTDPTPHTAAGALDVNGTVTATAFSGSGASLTGVLKTTLTDTTVIDPAGFQLAFVDSSGTPLQVSFINGITVAAASTFVGDIEISPAGRLLSADTTEANGINTAAIVTDGGVLAVKKIWTKSELASGNNGGTTGVVRLYGSTSGVVSIFANPVAGTPNIFFPTSDGTVALTSQLFDPAIPGAIGGTTPAAGTFTTLTTTGAIELGHASDTPLARVSAGVVAINGVNIVTDARINSGTLAASFTNINFATTTGADAGVIKQNGARVISSYGTENFFIGPNTGNATLTGIQNFAFGHYASPLLSTGSYNTSGGRGAGYSITTGARNTSIGADALGNNSTSSDNTAIGSSAGYFATSASGTYIGRTAGLNVTSGTHGTFLGMGSNGVAGAHNYQMAIGAGATVSGTGSYQQCIGAGATVSTANTFVIGRSADNVNIPGTVSVGSIAGAATGATKLAKLVSSIADNTATDVLTVTIPNAAHAGMLRVTLLGRLGAGGAIGAEEATGCVSYDLAIARTAGVATVVTSSAAYGSATSSVAGAAAMTITAAPTGMAGGVGATQTFTVQVTIDAATGASTNHKCTVMAEILNANATGITIA